MCLKRRSLFSFHQTIFQLLIFCDMKLKFLSDYFTTRELNRSRKYNYNHSGCVEFLNFKQKFYDSFYIENSCNNAFSTFELD